MPKATLRWAAEIVGVALVYYAAARLGLLLQLPGTNASPVWPPSGIGLAALLLLGLRASPGIALGAFLANLLTLPASLAGLAASGAIAAGNTLEPVIALLLLRRFATSAAPFERARGVFVFVLAAAVVCAVASTSGATSLWLAGIISGALYAEVWITWWLGDAAGMLVLTPALYGWCRSPRLGMPAVRVVELVLLIAASLGAAEILFGGWIASEVIASLPYLLVPGLLWAAFRFGPRETATLAVLLSAVAIVRIWWWSHPVGGQHGSQRAVVPFLGPETSANESLLMLQIFVCAVAVTAIALAATIAEKRRGEDSLRQSEQRSRAMIESALDAVVSIDQRGNLTGWSPQAEAMFGWTRDEVLGRQMAELIIPERHRDAHHRGLRHFLATGEGPVLNKRVELSALRRGGEEFPIELTITVLQVDGRHEFSAFVRDLSERERAEAAQREADERFRHAFQHGLIGIAITSPERRLLQVNDALCAMLGYTREQLEAKTWVEVTHPDDVAPNVALLERALAGGTDTYGMEKRFVRSDGQIVHTEIAVRCARNPDRSVNYLVLVVKDLTERKRNEERLRVLHSVDRGMLAGESPEAIARAALEPLRDLLDVPRVIVNLIHRASGEAEWLAAAGRRRIRVGSGVRFPAALLGDVEALERGETQVIDTHALPPSEHKDALLASGVGRYMAVPMRVGGELIGALSFGGAPRPFAQNMVEIAREVADQMALAISHSQLRERVMHHAADLERRVRERTAELEAANKELESFSYSVSHDLRAPLRAMDGFARLLDLRYQHALDAEGRRLLGVVRDASRRMGALVDDLLKFSRLGRQEMTLVGVDMSALVAQALSELEGRRAAAVRVGALPPARGDPALLMQVWLNLLSNALKYSAARVAPVVEVSGRQQHGENVYSVRDNGVGFDMRFYDKLFGVFQRLHGADEFSGTGVGLAIVQRIVTRHGGRVWAESEVDAGAAFYFSLPRSS